VLPTEPGNDALVSYYNGSLDNPFGVGFTDEFLTCEERVVKGFDKMPKDTGKRSTGVNELVEHLVATYRK
jgi:hypothetical protein